MCKATELANGQVRSVRILAQTVIVVRLDGQIYGLEGNCKHMKASLASGEIDGSVIKCTMHGWRYDLLTGQCLNESWAKLKTYDTFEADGFVWVDVI